MKYYAIPHRFLKRDAPNPSFKIAAVIATILFGLGVLTSYVLSNAARSQYIRSQTDRAAQQSTSLITHISVKTAVYEQSLLASAGLLAADGVQGVTEDKWNAYVDSLQLQHYAPEDQGVGFSQNVASDQAADFVQQMRDNGLPNFNIIPAGQRDAYSVITFNRTFNYKVSLAGYDLLSNPDRRATMERARDTGRLAMTGPVVLRSDQRSSKPQTVQAVILFYPVYASGTPPTTLAERRANILGYVYTGYRIQDMLQAVGLTGSKQSTYALWDITGKPIRLTASAMNSQNAPAIGSYTYTQQLHIGGRTWKVQVAVAHSAYQRIVQPILLFAAGLGISLCISVLAFTLLFRRFQSVQTHHEQELQRTKDELLALASHQLRTPATSARQYIGILLQGYFGTLNAEQLGIAKKAYASNERQLEVIDQVLYVAKADSGQLMLNPESFDLREFTRGIIEDFADQVTDKQLKLRLAGSKQAVPCLADKRYARMIIENLISNAIKYSYPGSKVEVRVAPAANQATVAVTDHGVGIAKTDLPKLFQKFSRIQNPLSQKEGGSGLGLFLASKLAQAHGGIITVNSKSKQGSTFTLRLPLKTAGTKNVIQLTE
jgi:signal transduction histidine kinase